MDAGSVAAYSECKGRFSRYIFVGPICNLDESGVIATSINIYLRFADEVCRYILSVWPRIQQDTKRIVLVTKIYVSL